MVMLLKSNRDQLIQTFMNNLEYTDFGEKIREIYKNPKLPQNPLPQSHITLQEHTELADKWFGSIRRKHSTGVKKGLSLDEFTKLVNEFFGFPAINRSLLDRLIHTGNPLRENYAKSLKKETLLIVSYFSREYTYNQLEELAERTLRNSDNFYKNIDGTQEKENQTHEIEIETKTETKTNQESKETKNMSLKNLVLTFIEERGYRPLVEGGIKPEDILEILSEKYPKLDTKTFLLLPRVLGISPADFTEILKNDII